MKLSDAEIIPQKRLSLHFSVSSYISRSDQDSLAQYGVGGYKEKAMNESTEIIVAEPQPLIYVPDVDKAIEAWNAYQDLCKRLLVDSDYAKIRGKKHRKRSGWSKLRRAFSITAEIIEEKWEDLGDGEFGYFVIVRAGLPDGRYEDGDGYCDSTEMRQGRLEPTRHNVRSKAITRAKNRATADVIGSGEVSAEEFIDSENEKAPIVQRTRQSTRRKQTPQPPASNGKMTRPMEPQFLRDALHKKAAKRDESGAMPATDKQASFLARKFSECFGDQSNPTESYHVALNWLWDVDSASKLTLAQANATLDWLLVKGKASDDTGDTPLHPMASKEANRVLSRAAIDAGQAGMGI